MNKPHKHAEMIKAWADGEIIQRMYDADKWVDDDPTWGDDEIYRIKPELKPDVVAFEEVRCYIDNKTKKISFSCTLPSTANILSLCNLKLTFDGETGKLKSAEVINND